MKDIIKKILKEEFDSKSDRVKSIVNRYGYVRASELIIGGIDTIREAYKDNPLEYLEQFNDLTPAKSDHPDDVDDDGETIYYIDKNRKVIFYYYKDEINMALHFDDYNICMFFEQLFNFTDNEINDIIKNWLEDTYNLKGITEINCEL